MRIEQRNYFITIIILVGGILLLTPIQRLRAVSQVAVRFEKVPLQIGEWRGKELPLSNDVFEILATKNVLHREYRDSEGDILYLTIVYADINRDSFHPPEICYVGGGAQFVEKRIQNFFLEETGEILRTNQLVMKFPHGAVTAWYWFSAGDTFTSNYYFQQLHFVAQVLKGESPSGALIKISTDGKSLPMGKKVEKFIQSMTPALRKYL